jgi:hypothetical protein
MKVSVCETVDIETEVDVSLTEVLSECARRAEESHVNHKHRLLGAIDWMTSILAEIPDDVVAALSDSQRSIISQRLTIQAKRYDEAVS